MVLSTVLQGQAMSDLVEEIARKTKTDKSIHEGDNAKTENAYTLAGRTSATLPLCVEKGDSVSDMDSRSRSQPHGHVSHGHGQ